MELWKLKLKKFTNFFLRLDKGKFFKIEIFFEKEKGI